MTVTLGPAFFEPYERFSLYNSPYAAHDGGCAIDCYPGAGPERTTAAPSPVSGEVLEVRRVRAPPKPYAPDHDHLLVVDCDGPASLEGYVARVLHVEPTVEPGDRIERGERLGRLLRAGFFAPWVDNHFHVGFRRPDQNHRRAAGSLPIEIGVPIRSLAWDGTGEVVETGETYAALDAPRHPNPGAEWVGVAADGGRVLDGGLPHYDGGGLLPTDGVAESAASGDRGDRLAAGAPVASNGDRLGVLADDGRTIAWDDVVVTVDGEPVTGLSLFCARDAGFGAKLICPERAFAVGERVRVRIERAGPTRE